MSALPSKVDIRRIIFDVRLGSISLKKSVSNFEINQPGHSKALDCEPLVPLNIARRSTDRREYTMQLQERQSHDRLSYSARTQFVEVAGVKYAYRKSGMVANALSVVACHFK